MSANLTQQYRKAEQAWRKAETPQEELACLQAMLIELPKHKGTDKMQADLKQKISRVKKVIGSQSGKGPGKPVSTKIPRQGAGRAVIIGAANAGKSQLLATMTKAKPTVANYPFSTTQPMPGMMPWEDVFVQLIDTAPIMTDAIDPVTFGLIRGADLVLLLMDLGSDDGGEQLMDVVNRFNESKSRLGRKTEIVEHDVGVTFTETLLLANKVDLDDAGDRLQFFDEFVNVDFDRFLISTRSRHQDLGCGHCRDGRANLFPAPPDWGISLCRWRRLGSGPEHAGVL